MYACHNDNVNENCLSEVIIAIGIERERCCPRAARTGAGAYPCIARPDTARAKNPATWGLPKNINKKTDVIL